MNLDGWKITVTGQMGTDARVQVHDPKGLEWFRGGPFPSPATAFSVGLSEAARAVERATQRGDQPCEHPLRAVYWDPAKKAVTCHRCGEMFGLEPPAKPEGTECT